MTELIAHLESYLGEISGGTSGDDSTPDGLQVVWFGANRPHTGVTTIARLGLSRHHLAQSGGKGLHQELLMHLPMVGQPRNAAGLLFQVAAELIARGRGLLRGEVIGPRGPLFGSGQMTALYAAAPGYLPDGFDVCDTGTVTVVMTWLVPITDTEANYVRARGWSAFEDALVAEDPDLVDLSRSPVTAVGNLGE
jgi:hypothetical protein